MEVSLGDPQGPQSTDDKNDEKKDCDDFTPTLGYLLIWLVLDSNSYLIYIYIWLVVSNMAFIFHFIYGIILPIGYNIFQDC